MEAGLRVMDVTHLVTQNTQQILSRKKPPILPPQHQLDDLSMIPIPPSKHRIKGVLFKTIDEQPPCFHRFRYLRGEGTQ